MSVTLVVITILVLVVVVSIIVVAIANISYGIGNTQSDTNDIGTFKAEKPKIAEIQDVPYIVRVLIRTEDKSPMENDLYTGNIIHELWVLTTTRFLYDKEDTYFIYEIMAGVSTGAYYGSDSQKRLVSEFVIHPKWVPRKQNDVSLDKYDLYLLKVSEKLDITDKVQVLQISNGAWLQDKEMYQKVCYAVGWDRMGDEYDHHDTSRIIIRKVKATHGKKSCICKSPSDNELLICGELNTGERVSEGEAGGALVYNGEMVGVAVRTYRKGECYPSFPQEIEIIKESTVDAYAFICPHLNWIASHVPGIDPQPKSCRTTSVSARLPIILFTMLVRFINLE